MKAWKRFSLVLVSALFIVLSVSPASALESQVESKNLILRGEIFDVPDVYYFVVYSDGTYDDDVYYKEVNVPNGYRLVSLGREIKSIVTNTWYKGKKADTVTKYLYSYALEKI